MGKILNFDDVCLEFLRCSRAYTEKAGVYKRMDQGEKLKMQAWEENED